MEWFFNAATEWIVFGIIGVALWVGWRRLGQFTVPNSNEPFGVRTDWRGFFGLRRR